MCHHFHLYSKGAKKTKELFLTGFNFQTPSYTYISENVVLNQEIINFQNLQPRN